jgi:hypothetical protein
MAKWFDDVITDKLRNAGNHVILVPARNPNVLMNIVDIYDGVTGKFIAANVPEEAAITFATVWNKLVDANENTEITKYVNLSWLNDVQSERRYNN